LTTTSIGTKLGFRKLTACIGAEVTGVSPSHSVTGDASHYTPVAAGRTA
jgi:hypothetical protein